MSDDNYTPYWFHRVEVKLTVLVQSTQDAADVRKFFEEYYAEGVQHDLEAFKAVPEVVVAAFGGSTIEDMTSEQIECADVIDAEVIEE